MADETEAPDSSQPAAAATAAPVIQQPASPQAPVPGTIGSPDSLEMPNPAPTMPAPNAPTVTPVPPRTGLAGIIDSFRDAIGGNTRQQVATDAQGNKYIQTSNATSGQKWARVIDDAVHGAAAGWSAGRGAGHGGDALLAGVNSADKLNQQRQQQDQSQNAEVRQAKLDQFNDTMQKQQILKNQFDLTHMQQQATQGDIGFEKDRIAEEEGLKSAYLGTYSGIDTLPEIQKAHPEILKDFYNKKDVQIIPHIDPQTGKHDGVSVYLRRPGVDGQVLPPGQKFYTSKMDEQGHWQLGTAETSVPMKQTEIDALNNAAHTKVGDQQNLFATQKTAADKAAANLAHTKAQTQQAQAETSKLYAEVNKLKNPTADDPNIASLGEAVAKGSLTQDMLSKMKGGALTAVQTYLAKAHPNLMQSSVFLTASERKQVDLAENSLHNVDSMESILQRRPDLLGKLQGRITQGKIGTGTDDKDLGTLEETLDNFALSTTGTHGTKAQAAREDAKKALLNGFKNGPQAVQGAIAAAKSSLGNLAAAGKPKGLDGKPYVYKDQPQGGTPAAPAAATAPTSPQGPPAGATGEIWIDGKLAGYQVNGQNQLFAAN